MKQMIRLPALCIVALIALSSPAARGQQQACSVEGPYQGDAYKIRIGDAPYIAIGKQEYVNLQNELAAAEKNVKRYGEVIAHMEAGKAELEKQINDLPELIAKHKEYAGKLEFADRKCEQALKACLSAPRLTLEGGIGLTGDSEAAAVLGLGYGKFRVWGFFQEGNSGAIAGLSIPLF